MAGAVKAWRVWTSLMLAVVLAGVADCACSQPTATEAGVKAAYLFKFLSYVEWPQAARPVGNAPLVTQTLRHGLPPTCST